MLFSRFLRDRSASVVPLLGLSLVPLTALVGAAVDYSRAAAARTTMQAAVDSTVLAVAKQATSLSPGALQTNVANHFNAVFVAPNVVDPTVTGSYSSAAGSQLVVTASGTVKTMFMNVAGFAELPISATATAEWGSRLRVALALDTTGSMNSAGKLAALKTATKALLTQLQNAVSEPGDVHVAIVPFAKDVNVGPDKLEASWIDWSSWEAPPAGVTPAANVGPGSSCPFAKSSHGFQCTTGPATGSSTTTTIPSSGSYKGYICPSVDSGNVSSPRLGRYYNGCWDSTKYTCTGADCTCTDHANCACSGSGAAKTCGTNSGFWEHKWIVNARTTWTGCVTDRDQNSDVSNIAPGVGASFPAEQYQYCTSSLMPLSYDWAALDAKVDAMVAAGSTNQTIGLVWGWHALTQAAPLSAPALDPARKYKQVVILLSDGLNTQNRWSGNGSSQSSQVDTRTAAACQSFKAADTTMNEIFTVQVNTGGDPTSTLLQDCASNTPGTLDHFFLLTSADQIVTTFQSIGNKMSKLHLAK